MKCARAVDPDLQPPFPPGVPPGDLAPGTGVGHRHEFSRAALGLLLRRFGREPEVFDLAQDRLQAEETIGRINLGMDRLDAEFCT